MSEGLQCQLQELDDALASHSADNERLKSAMEVTTLSDMSWFLPRFPRVVSRLSVPLDMPVFKPLMMQLPKVCVRACVHCQCSIGVGQLPAAGEQDMQHLGDDEIIRSSGTLANCCTEHAGVQAPLFACQLRTNTMKKCP
jgi:hypothetical protein